MVVNFRARRISRGAHKLTRTPTLIKKTVKSTKIDNQNNKHVKTILHGLNGCLTMPGQNIIYPKFNFYNYL